MTNRLNLSIQFACARTALPERRQFFAWARAALTGGGTVTIRLVEVEEARALNLEYRGKDYATNVLSFSYGEVSADPPCTEGDLLICPSVVFAEASAQAKAPLAHFAHLVVHGMLHLQGWDHDSADQAAAMEKREREILAKFGYDDPYVYN